MSVGQDNLISPALNPQHAQNLKQIDDEWLIIAKLNKFSVSASSSSSQF
jgi:hypothetical protein